MNNSLESWLQAWADWLDALLATGVGRPSVETSRRIQAWCTDADLLGFNQQSRRARLLLDSTAALAQRQQAFLDLVLEQDMLARLHDAHTMLAIGENVETDPLM